MKTKVLDSLKDKKCVLCGNSGEAEEFFKRNNDKLNVRAFTSLFDAEIVAFQNNDTGIECIGFNEICHDEGYFLIICNRDELVFYYNMLISSGKKEIADFVFSDLAHALLENKDICLMMGTQIVRQIYEALKSNRLFCEKYYPVFFSEDHLLKPYKNRMLEYIQFGRIMDVYIYGNSDVQMYNTKVLDMNDREYISISISDSTFNGMFPQYTRDRSVISDWLYRRFERDDMYYGTVMMAREDKNISRMITDGYSDEDIIKEISRLDFYSTKDIEDNLTACMSAVRDKDYESDIKLTSMIESMRENCPYINMDEWSAAFLELITTAIEETLGIEHDLKVDFEELVKKYCGTELLIYPSVADYFGVEIKNEYKVVSYRRTEYLSYRDYLMKYIGNIRKIMELKKIDETF